MGGSNQSLFLIGALVLSQGSAAIPLLALGLVLSLAAAPGWTELVLMWPNRVGGIAATCAEAFRPYNPVLANIAGVCYWWGWVPTCGLTALLSATAIQEWYLTGASIPLLASGLVLVFTAVNLCGVRWVTRLALPIAGVSALLALLSALIPLLTGHMNWHRATSFHLVTPFHGVFGQWTSLMAGLYLIGFAAPAFEAATCHVGETVDPVRHVPRAMAASAVMATLYFLVLPVVWLGVLGAGPLAGNLQETLDPTFAPWLGDGARAAAIGFMMFNMFHGTLQPLAGASRTLMQLAEDGLLPRLLALRSRTDTPWVATIVTAGTAIALLLTGDPVWVIAAANLAYLVSIGLPSIAVWLLRRDEPAMKRPYRAPRGTIMLGVLAAGCWGVATGFGFEQFGLPTVLAGIALSLSGVLFYIVRRWSDHRRAGIRGIVMARSLHVKLTGALLLVLTLDGAGYFLAVTSAGQRETARIAGLEDIFVVVALLTIAVGLVLPGMVAHAVSEVADAAETLATGTLLDFVRAMQALSRGDLEGAHVRPHTLPLVVRTRDEVGAMAMSFNTMQEEIAHAALALDGAREGLQTARDETHAALDAQQQINQRLGESEERFRRTFDQAPIGIAHVSPSGQWVRVNQGICDLLGYTSEELLGTFFQDATHPDDLPANLKLFQGLMSGDTASYVFEKRYIRKDGSLVWGNVTTSLVCDDLGNPHYTISVIENITERRELEGRLRHQALHDPLTGLPNRLLANDRLERAILGARRTGTPQALLLIDLDRFKEVNDTMGHHSGDTLLQEVARRLARVVRVSDTVARLGGDEFAILLPDTDERAANHVASKVQEGLRQPLVLEGHRLDLNASIGIAVYPDHGSDAETITRRADMAMYAAKGSGGGHRVYLPAHNMNSLSRLALVADLRHAIEHEQLLLQFQPKVTMQSGMVVEMEALVRWQHPEHGIIPPGEFIPLAEETGLIEPLTLWVLRTALAHCAAWRDAGVHVRVAVNLSTRNLHDPGLVDAIGWMTRRLLVPASSLTVEITESSLMVQPEAAMEVLGEIHGLGVRIAIDDFGTGYSSLAYLEKLPVDEIKIDQSFIQRMTRNGTVIVRSVIDLGHNLGIEVTAEGVEDQGAWETLKTMGCGVAQGYHVSRPLESSKVVPWILEAQRGQRDSLPPDLGIGLV
jgi:diguanylate cyclase (GGDEF)-like protein/PAS domain S-box-containing protein